MMKRFLLVLVAVVLVGSGALLAQNPGAPSDNGAIPPSTTLGPACPIVINGTLGSGSPDWPSTSGNQTGRLNRNGVGSTCAAPKVCDIFLTDPGRAYDAYVIPNTTGAAACVVIELEVITQTGCNLQSNAYLNTYDPANICTGYLADPGFSSGTPPSITNYEGTVPNGDDLIVVVHTTNPGETGCEYQVRFSGDCVPVELQGFDIE